MRTTTTLFCLSALLTLNAQTTALDFTANDCDGMPHNLFSELDAGNAVVLELVMMGCQPCVDAAHSITDNVIPNVSDPTRVKYYSIGYTNSITCTQINNWKNTNGFTHQVFAGMSAQTTYYGGMGMPTVVVLGGGSTHGVYYSELGHSDGDNPTIISVMNSALSEANGVAENGARTITLGPNPTTGLLNLNATYISARVVDAQGRSVMNMAVVGASLDVSTLAAGHYTLELMAADKSRAVGRFVKQ